MGKLHRPASSLALALAVITPAPALADEDKRSATERARQAPLKQVDVRDRGDRPDQESLDHEALARYRGSSNGDALSQLSGVQLNNQRNEAGALDVGIRGLQNEGRVAVVIDGALQSTHTHRGYQGESDRTYIDMDLVRSIDVTKGASIDGNTGGAIGGALHMRTLAPDDVILPGRQFGIFLKSSIANNSHTPAVPATERGQEYYILRNSQSPRSFGLHASTLAVAGRHERVDWLLAHSRRRDGNYFAGRHGAERYGKQIVVNPGQEVVNTSYQGDSSLAKLGFKLTGEQRLSFIWRHHEQRAGEVMAAYWRKNRMDGRGGGWLQPWPEGVESMPQWSLGSARLNSYSGTYTYRPVEQRLVDFSLGVWKTEVLLDQHNGLMSGPPEARFGDQYLHRYDDIRQGLNLTNRSHLAGEWLRFDYGISGEEQRSQPLNFKPRNWWSTLPSARDARRSEYAAWLNGRLQGTDAWLELGTRWHGAAVTDYLEQSRIAYAPRTDVVAQWQVGLLPGLDTYGKVARAWRQPSLFESSTSSQVFSYDRLNPLRAEQTRSWELGLSGRWRDVLLARSTLTAKVGYFSNNVVDYISGAQLPERVGMMPWQSNFTFTNYDRFELKGWEAKLGVDAPLFFVEAGGTLYDQPRACSRQLSQQDGGPECTDVGFNWGLLPTRIPPRRAYHLSGGVRLLESSLTMGARMRYHGGKRNPGGWLNGTGATAMIDIPSERLLDLFATWQIEPRVALQFNIDNLQDRYTLDPGTVVAMPRPGRTIRLALSAQF